MAYILDFEKPLSEIEKQIQALQKKGDKLKVEEQKQLVELRQELKRQTCSIYQSLTAWQTVQVARHKDRPHALDYLRFVFDDFFELRGDRVYADNASIVGGPALLDGKSVMFIGQEKGRDLKERRHHNAGQPHPEGFRKAYRLMQHAEKFGLPLVCFVDTPGASIALDDESRGQSRAIANNLLLMSRLRVPIIVVIIGEGGSGGALALSLGDRLLMLEHTYFSVASPESAATILVRDEKYASDMATAMQVSARQLHKLGLVDEIVPEAVGGAHQGHGETAHNVRCALIHNLDALKQHDTDELVERRYQKYRAIGQILAL